MTIGTDAQIYTGQLPNVNQKHHRVIQVARERNKRRNKGKGILRRDQPWWSWLRHCATRLEVARSIPGSVLENIQMTSSFCSHSLSVGFTQSVTETKNLPNVKVRMEAQHSVSPLGLHDLLRERFRSTRKEINAEIHTYMNGGRHIQGVSRL